MSRLLSLTIAILLLPAMAVAAPAHKRMGPHSRGYGFLPGYHQPLSNTVPLYGPKIAIRGPAGRSRRPWYIDRTPGYYYNGDWHYFGQPGFYRGQYNGGSFGPCWTITPIGRVWNCG